MLNITDLLKKFQSLPYNKRKELAMKVLDKAIKAGNQNAKNIFEEIISFEGEIPVSLYDTIYEDLLNGISENNMIQSKNIFDKTRQLIQRIHEKEEKDKETEGSVDDLINKISII